MTIEKNQNIFGLYDSTEEDSSIVLIPVPWEVTTSYGSGASFGPQTVLEASPQLDLCDLQFGEAYRQGIHMNKIPNELQEHNNQYKIFAQTIIEELDHQDPGETLSSQAIELQKTVNEACQQVNEQVYQQSKQLITKNKIVGVIGGDHSTPEGLIKALHEQHEGDFGILHIDAHADLRKNYQGFQHSHASIMYNVMTGEYRPKKLVQVAIRDFCQEEKDFIQKNSNITTFFDRELKKQMFNGKNWNDLCNKIISELPDKVYISFDIDGLTPDLCPHTGTPVPGGLNFDQVVHLISCLYKHNKSIIGFDLVEVAPDPQNNNEWDGNVGARVLYQLCGWALATQGLIEPQEDQ